MERGLLRHGFSKCKGYDGGTTVAKDSKYTVCSVVFKIK